MNQCSISWYYSDIEAERRENEIVAERREIEIVEERKENETK
jgi:hypothetical protein